MNRTHKILIYALLAASLFAYVVYRGAHRGSDLKYPYGAARLLWQTGRLHVSAQPRYPLTIHVLLAPLAARPLGLTAAVTLWAALSFAATAALPPVLARLTGVPFRRQLPAWALVAPFFLDALILGQSDPINLLLASAGTLAATQGRGTVGSLLIGLAGLIKVLPFAQWGALLLRGPRKGTLLGIALTLLLAGSLVSAAVGPRAALAGFREQYQWVQHHEKPWHLIERGTDLRANNESLPIVLARTFGDIPRPLVDRDVHPLARLPLGLIWAAWLAILATLAAACLLAALWSRRLPDPRARLALFALTSLAMLAATPICWNHYFLWTLPAALYLHARPRFLLTLAAASLLITAIPALRGAGGHMAMTFALFARVLLDLRAESLLSAIPRPISFRRLSAGSPSRHRSAPR